MDSHYNAASPFSTRDQHALSPVRLGQKNVSKSSLREVRKTLKSRKTVFTDPDFMLPADQTQMRYSATHGTPPSYLRPRRVVHENDSDGTLVKFASKLISAKVDCVQLGIEAQRRSDVVPTALHSLLNGQILSWTPLCTQKGLPEA